MAEHMVRHVEGNSNNMYWSEDIKKLTEKVERHDTIAHEKSSVTKKERHDAYRRQQKDERHDTKWKYIEK
eukprot:11828897-Heterocapsa_arctica.AAC.1